VLGRLLKIAAMYTASDNTFGASRVSV